MADDEGAGAAAETTAKRGMKEVKEKRPFTDEEAESTIAEYMEA